jgi:hypothetical protein
VGISTLSLLEPASGSSSGSWKDNISAKLAKERRKQAGFIVYDWEEGFLALGPYVPGKVCLSRATYFVYFPLLQLLILNQC